MDDEREVEFTGNGDLSPEYVDLSLSWGKVVMVVESDLPDGNGTGAFERGRKGIDLLIGD